MDCKQTTGIPASNDTTVIDELAIYNSLGRIGSVEVDQPTHSRQNKATSLIATPLHSFQQVLLRMKERAYVGTREPVRSFSKRIRREKAGTKGKRTIDPPAKQVPPQQNRIDRDHQHEATRETGVGARFWTPPWELECFGERSITSAQLAIRHRNIEQPNRSMLNSNQCQPTAC